MNAGEARNLDELKSSCATIGFVEATYGIAWPPSEPFAGHFADWCESRRSKTCDGSRIDRYAFEMLLRTQRLTTRKYASASLGMTPRSLDRVLTGLPKLGLPKKYEVYPGIIDESLSQDLVRFLPGLRFRTFGSHDSFCERLHPILRAANGMEVEPLWCATAQRFGERTFASTWDNITLLPLSVRHGVWLDLGKPVALPPDRCSKLFFAENYEELKSNLAGRRDPRDIEDYRELLRRSA